MCYNFSYRLVLELYILFQYFLAVLITQKLGSNFKYQLHCIMACVIIITLIRFLNLEWFINLSSFNYSKQAYLTTKTYSKSSWALPINKYDLAKFFPSLFFIKVLVSIFKAIINFILKILSMYFLTVNIFLTFLRMNFWYYALLILFLLMSLTYAIHFQYFTII